jgi:hypothetical protein
LIGTPLGMPEADQKADIVLGHWHEGTSLKVLRWAEVPSIPEGIELRPLSDSDLKG